MPAIVIATENNALLGFLLTAERDLAPGKHSDFVLTGFPKDPALLDSPQSEFLQEHKNTEYTLAVSGGEAHMELASDLGDGWQVSLMIEAGGAGKWRAAHRDGRSLGGCCGLAQRG